MEIILAKDYPSLGFVGDSIKVKSGYARNYLIPEGIAVEASSRNASELKHRLSGILAVKKALKAEAQAKAEDLKKLDVSVLLKIGEGGKSFGSIGTKDIEAILVEKGLEVSRRQIQLQDPIRTVGEFPIQIKLHSEVIGEIILKVVADKVAEKQLAKKTRSTETVVENTDLENAEFDDLDVPEDLEDYDDTEE